MGPEEVGQRVRALWAERFPDSVRTVWPGERVSTSGLSVWVELWTSVWTRQPSRAGASEWDLVVTVQVFSRDRLNGARVWEVMEQAREALERQTVTWKEGDDSAVLRLFEVECEELTRREAAGWAKEFAHVAVRCAGRAAQVKGAG